MKEFTQQRRQNIVVICASTLARNTAFSQKLHKATPISILPKNDQIITNIYLFYSFIKYSVPLHKNRSTKPFSAKVTAAENPKHE